MREEKVVYATMRNVRPGHAPGADNYHADKDCHHLRDHPVAEITMKEATDELDLNPCWDCTGNGTTLKDYVR